MSLVQTLISALLCNILGAEEAEEDFPKPEPKIVTLLAPVTAAFTTETAERDAQSKLELPTSAEAEVPTE